MIGINDQRFKEEIKNITSETQEGNGGTQSLNIKPRIQTRARRGDAKITPRIDTN